MNYRKIILILQFLSMVALPLHAENAAPDNQIDSLRGKLLYEKPLATAEDVKGWVMEGPGKIEFKDGWMQMYSPNEEMHHVFWCDQSFPESFIAEWEVQNLHTERGLCIVFFAAKGENGEDIFDPKLPKRDGNFDHYILEKIVSYHISYYANGAARNRGDSHLRKNNKFILVQKGEEGIPTASKEIHKLQVVKNVGHIQMFIDERRIINWKDDGKEHGPVHTNGKIGFRQMKWTHFSYRDFKVWEIHP